MHALSGCENLNLEHKLRDECLIDVQCHIKATTWTSMYLEVANYGHKISI